MKKILKRLASMKFAVGLLLVIGLVSVSGTLIPQNAHPDFYSHTYGTLPGALILRLGLNDVYHALWYVALFALLLLSTLFCVVSRVKPILIIIREHSLMAALEKIGSWILHIGLILLVLFFGLSNFFAEDGQIYGIPGSSRALPEESMKVYFDDFTIDLVDNRYVDQYTSTVRFTDLSDKVLAEGKISVNSPMTVNGIQFSQASYGYAVNVRLLQKEEELGKTVLYQNQFAYSENSAIVLELVNVYPDYVETQEGPATKSTAMNNPYMLYRLYVNERVIDMNLVPVGTDIQYMDFTFETSDPAIYPVLATRKDPFLPFVALGAAVFFAGLMLVFFAPDRKKLEEKKNHGLHTAD